MVLKPEEFTEQAQEAIVRSQELLRTMKHADWDVEHLVAALLENPKGVPEKVLNDLRETCLYELKALAYAKGADAVIAIDLDYSEFSGGMLFLVASGTAVKLKE